MFLNVKVSVLKTLEAEIFREPLAIDEVDRHLDEELEEYRSSPEADPDELGSFERGQVRTKIVIASLRARILECFGGNQPTIKNLILLAPGMKEEVERGSEESLMRIAHSEFENELVIHAVKSVLGRSSPDRIQAVGQTLGFGRKKRTNVDKIADALFPRILGVIYQTPLSEIADSN